MNRVVDLERYQRVKNMDAKNIPKIIHYCWFGGNPLPELAQKCIASWQTYCPDYEIKRWDETNFDLNYNNYVREAYEAKKWAFVTDVVRLYALVNYGGIYMDTDVEVLKPLDEFLQYEAFSGFESKTQILTGIMASQKGQKMFTEFLSEYDGIHFIKSDGTYDLTTNVSRITNACVKYGFIPNNQKQTIHGFTLFPKDYFCPKDQETRIMEITDHTHTIHHFDGSWLSNEQRLRQDLILRYRKIMPAFGAYYFAMFLTTKHFHGTGTAVKETLKWIRRRLSMRSKNVSH